MTNQLFGSATVRVDRSGTVEVLAGASGHGQGHTTSWAQIAADQLGISHDQVKVYEGGVPVMALCVQSMEPIPDGDAVLMHKLMIEGNEGE